MHLTSTLLRARACLTTLLRALACLATLLLALSPAAAMPFADCPAGTVALAPGQAHACVEVARTEAQRELGLMHRVMLGVDSGMLFVFPEAALHRMWMKDTLVALSVAFLDESGTILNIEDMAPGTLTPHAASAPARYALEMPLGWFARRGLAAGSRVGGLPPADAAP